jgi:hypothetical protein
MDDFKAIVIIDSRNHEMRLRDTHQQRQAFAYVFKEYAPALAFMQASKVETVVVEFDVEIETLNFWDAAKDLKIPVVISTNSLKPHDLTRYGVRGSNVFYPGRTETAVQERAY